MKTIRVKESLAGEGWTAAKGEVIDLPEAIADNLIRSDLAEEVQTNAAPARVENREKAMRPPHDEKRKNSTTPPGNGNAAGG